MFALRAAHSRILFVASILLSASIPVHAQDGVIFSNEGGLEMETANGNFSAGVGGRIHIDGALYDEDVTDLGSGNELRRTWIKLYGTVYRDWAYKLEYEFAGGGDPSAKDVFIQYLGFDPVIFTVGHFKQPFSLTNLISTNYLTFTERALLYESLVQPDRRIGAGVNTAGESWSAAFAVFGETFDEDAGTDDEPEADSGVSLGARLTYAPWHEDGRVLHLGGAVNYFNPGGGQEDSFRFRTRPESHVTDVRLVDTGDGAITDVEDRTLYGLESAVVLGSWSAQGEYILADIGDSNAGSLDFDGWYVQTSWFLTGESRPYSVSGGDFGRIKPNNSYGAWQLAARYSTIDLTDGAIDGGEEDNVTLGVNWYANPRVRIMANYVIVVDHERQGVSDEPSAFQMRFQVDF